MKHTFNSTIIRAYDIRGVFNETFTLKDALVFGHLFASSLNGNKIVNVGFDGRVSSKPITESLTKGLVEGGATVNIIGLGPTPMLYYSCYCNDAEAAVMVTGSHNPSNHNGLKIVRNNLPFFGEDLMKLSKKSINYELRNNVGSMKTQDIKERYVKKLITALNQKKSMKIGWDAGNGSAGEIMNLISRKVLGENILLFDKIDGSFPNHHPDPSDPENLKDLQKIVIEKKLDLGIAFDGDGDRIGVVDNTGRIVSGDLLLLIFALDILKKKNNSVIIGDVKCSQILFDQVKKFGGKAVMSKTGHSLIKSAMKIESADLAGEMSGHMFFADEYYGFDDALYASVRLINILSKSNKKLSELLDEIPKLYNTPEIRIDCEDDEKFKIIEKIIFNQKNKNSNNIDGIRVLSKNGWWLMRASNTQPAIVLRCEANSEENLKLILEEVKNEIKLVSPQISLQI